jgi:23S rRNA (pseudouridine1915-N3)-methyltransferase
MRLELLLSGKTKPGFIEEGMDEYIKRIGKYISLKVKVLPDVKSPGKAAGSLIREREGLIILKQLKPGDYVILLDQRGTGFTSDGFAEFLRDRQIHATAGLKFVIGGAGGFSEEVYRRKDMMLSLSSMTYSHQLVRLIFLEQLYRALTIIHNEPYHLGH